MSKKVIVAIPYTGRTTRLTVPAGVLPTATAYLWGGGGGGGGDDSPGVGGNGATGQAYKVVFPVTSGDVLDFAPGGGGTHGSTSSQGSYSSGSVAVASVTGWMAVTWRAWDSFMNQFAIYVDPYNAIGTHSFTTQFLSSGGRHTIEIAADNTATIGIGPNTGIRSSNTFRGSTTVVSYNLAAGLTDISVSVVNESSLSAGNPGGIAITIKDPSDNIVWDTRRWVSGNYSYSTTIFTPARQGGTGGTGYIIGGDNFGGGNGGVSGPVGASGAGGGGGGASVIAKNSVVIAVAAGGGGGGGGGNRNTVNGDSASSQPTSDSVATVGQNGQDRSNDGGGAGGGGGGRFGGVGGTCRPGFDEGGGAGGSGVSWRDIGRTTSGQSYIPTNLLPAVVDGYSVGPTYATAGLRRYPGAPGYILIEFYLYALPYANVGGTWYPTRRAYVNINSNWKEIVTGYVKVGGQWQTLAQGQILAPGDLGPGVNYGAGGTRAR